MEWGISRRPSTAGRGNATSEFVCQSVISEAEAGQGAFRGPCSQVHSYWFLLSLPLHVSFLPSGQAALNSACFNLSFLPLLIGPKAIFFSPPFCCSDAHRNPYSTHQYSEPLLDGSLESSPPLNEDWGLSSCPPHHSSACLPPLPSNAASWLSLVLYFCFLPSLFIALSPPNHPCIYPVA